MFLVLGIDGATWKVVSPNLDQLPTFKKLVDIGQARELTTKEELISASIWCGMFCGKTLEEHGHRAFVVDGNIVRREDIKVDFIWDVVYREGRKVKALNIPFVVPPYSFNVDFKPPSFGLPTNEMEWREELDRVTEKAKEVLAEKPDLFIVVYTLLDRIQHFHWGEEYVLEWYKKLDARIGELLFQTHFLEEGDNKLIVISDHGFCPFGEARVQTLPRKTKWGELKGDHHEAALLIAVNLSSKIERPQDVFFVIKEEFGIT